MITLKGTTILRRGTTAEWAASTYVPADAELCFDTQARILKIGNGSDPWARLPQANEGRITYTLEEGTVNGQVVLKGSDGTAVPASVHGLGDLAFKNEVEYSYLEGSVRESLGKADTAVQQVVTGSADGCLTVDGQEVTVRGWDNVAKKNGTDFTGAITVLAPTADMNPATKKYVDDAIAGITEFDVEVHETKAELPAQGQKGVIYLVKHDHSDPASVYDEYLWIAATSTYERIGSTDIDMSQYSTTAQMNEAIAAAIKALDVAAITVGASKTIQTIQETDGKISVVAVDIAIAMSQVTGLATALSGKQDTLTFDGTYNASTNKAATVKSITDRISDAIKGLKKADTAVDGQYVSAVSQENGIITVTRKALPSVPVTDVKGEADADNAKGITVTKSGTVYTASHKGYATGDVKPTDQTQPYMITEITVDKGHVMTAKIKTLATALNELGPYTIDGGKADGTF